MPRTLICETNDPVGFVTVDETVGEPGEQGEVWVGHAQGYPKVKFAVKVAAKPISGTNDPAFQRFENEFAMLAALDHPNIVKVFACGVFEKGGAKHPYYIMEYLGKVQTLAKALGDPARSIDQQFLLCLHGVLKTAGALKHAHSADGDASCHRDIKGPNILVGNGDAEPRIKLIDFGFGEFLRDIPSDGDTAGRMTRNPSSHHHPGHPRTNQHLDIWQLAYTFDSYFGPIRNGVKAVDKTAWPIDHADFQRLQSLIADWASTAPGNPSENREINDFYRELDEITFRSKTTGLNPEARGAVRYFSVPEIATAARIQPAFQAMRIPPRQLVLYTERVTDLITREQVGRLRYVRQLGFTHLVYPGAQGTRFEHSIGVFDLARQFIIRMAGHTPFRQVCGHPKDALKLVLAALLHDVGHFPFSHQLEEFQSGEHDFPTANEWALARPFVTKHDARSQTIIDRLAPTLRTQFELTAADIADVKSLVCESPPNGAQSSLAFLHGLLNGPVDLDKLDYIERDAHHCGVPYGNFVDIDRVLETMRIVEDFNSHRAILAFDRRGVGCLEQIVTARHQMFANVYWHRAVRSATAMFKHAFYLFQQLIPSYEILDEVFFRSCSDDHALALMKGHLESRDRTDPRVLAATNMLAAVSGQNRVLFKEVVHEEHTDRNKRRYGSLAYGSQRIEAKRIYTHLKSQGLLTDEADATGGEHHVLIDCRSDDWPEFENITVIDADGNQVSLFDEAPSLKNCQDNFIRQACRIRVFVNPSALEPQFRSKEGRVLVGVAIRARPQ